jgi:hypothetical protein
MATIDPSSRTQFVASCARFSLGLLLFTAVSPGAELGTTKGIPANELSEIRTLLRDQQTELEQLRIIVREQQLLLRRLQSDVDGVLRANDSVTPNVGRMRLEPALLEPASYVKPMSSAIAPELEQQLSPARPESVAVPTVRGESAAPALPRIPEVAGFRFSGDFIYVFDAQARSGNQIAPALQNLRSRYRVRFNVDRTLHEKVQFHLQLSTAPFNNQLTVLEDFAGIAPKAPFSIAEAWIAYNPNRIFSFRAGRMEETFMDGSRYLIDENLRLNGFEQIARIPVRGGAHRFFDTLEFRAGEYILTNPNLVAVAAGSPYVAAGYPVGSHVGAADLFHPGIILRKQINDQWSQRITASVQVYRNPNQIQLASTPAGASIAGEAVGVVMSGPLTGSGNATTTPGGARYAADGFRIAHLGYRLENNALFRMGGGAVPGFIDLQTSRNVAANRLRDGVMAIVGVGNVRKAGDLRGVYQFAIKGANSMVSQLTDDDLGTGTGVNIGVHALRFDLGITRFLQFQNVLYIQNAKSPSSPEQNFYVPLPKGANTTFRLFSQLLFTF